MTIGTVRSLCEQVSPGLISPDDYVFVHRCKLWAANLDTTVRQLHASDKPYDLAANINFNVILTDLEEAETALLKAVPVKVGGRWTSDGAQIEEDA